MMITRESDYGVRIIRALKDGGLMTIGQICERECIPKQFAYKILKKLELAGLVQIKRGFGGGCALARDLADMTLYDVIRATDEEFFLTHCLQADFDCEYLAKSPCTIHRELARVQGILDQELRAPWRSCWARRTGSGFGSPEPGAPGSQAFIFALKVDVFYPF